MNIIEEIQKKGYLLTPEALEAIKKSSNPEQIVKSALENIGNKIVIDEKDLKIKEKAKEIFKITGIPVVIASLCCLSPVIVVLLGVGTVGFASSLADTLYGDYKWVFRSVGLLALAASLVMYLRRAKGVCTFDQVKKRRNEIINIVVVSLAATVAGYFFFLYVVVHYAGVLLDLWK